jgi:pectate lyase
MNPTCSPALRSALAAIGAALLVVPTLPAAVPPPADQDAARMHAVVEFADNVLRDAADHEHKDPTPLLANGVNVLTKARLQWHLPDKQVMIISDLTVQQNLMRELAALTNLTGDAKYKNAAKAQFAYYFAHFQDDGGLLYWGGHKFVDQRSLTTANFKSGVHELKNVFPYYELMYEVNPAATVEFITGFWNAHIYNWQTLEVSRHGEYGHKPGAQWDQKFDDPAPYFETKGLSFLDAGNDLIYSAAMLYRLAGDQGALLWARRLAVQYVKARDPKTGLGAYQFTQPKKTEEPTDDSITMSWMGDRAKRQFGPDFPGHRVLEGTMLLHRLATTIYSENALMQLEVAQALGADGKEFLDWTHQGMAAFARYAYIPEKNLLRPMLTDGTDLSGFTLKRNGYYGRMGMVLEPYQATPDFMISYARGFMLTGDANLWTLARGSAKAGDMGDIGAAPGKDVQVNLATRNNDPFALFSILDIYRQTHTDAYLQLARAIGNNIVKTRFHHGYFTRFDDQIWANVDVIEPYALLALEAAIKGVPDKVPYFINGSGFIDGVYMFPDGTSRAASDGMLYRARQSAPDINPNIRDPNAQKTE